MTARTAAVYHIGGVMKVCRPERKVSGTCLVNEAAGLLLAPKMSPDGQRIVFRRLVNDAAIRPIGPAQVNLVDAACIRDVR